MQTIVSIFDKFGGHLSYKIPHLPIQKGDLLTVSGDHTDTFVVISIHFKIDEKYSYQMINVTGKLYE